MFDIVWVRSSGVCVKIIRLKGSLLRKGVREGILFRVGGFEEGLGLEC